MLHTLPWASVGVNDFSSWGIGRFSLGKWEKIANIAISPGFFIHSFIHAVIIEYVPCAEEGRASNILSKMIQFQECEVSWEKADSRVR